MNRAKQFIAYAIEEIETGRFITHDGKLIKHKHDAMMFHWEDDAIDELEEKYDINKFRVYKIEFIYGIDLEDKL